MTESLVTRLNVYVPKSAEYLLRIMAAENGEFVRYADFAASEAARIKAEGEVERLREALEPFAKHLDEMRFDIDNNGNPLPDDQAVGWVYVTNGDFRRARAALRREP